MKADMEAAISTAKARLARAVINVNQQVTLELALRASKAEEATAKHAAALHKMQGIKRAVSEIRSGTQQLREQSKASHSRMHRHASKAVSWVVERASTISHRYRTLVRANTAQMEDLREQLQDAQSARERAEGDACAAQGRLRLVQAALQHSELVSAAARQASSSHTQALHQELHRQNKRISTLLGTLHPKVAVGGTQRIHGGL